MEQLRHEHGWNPEDLESLLAPERVHLGEAARRDHASDETEDLVFVPDAVVEPTSTAEVSRILAYAHAHHVPVTAAGARTGLSGGALPVQGGILLSTRRMNRLWPSTP